MFAVSGPTARRRNLPCNRQLATPSYMVAFACFSNTEHKPTTLRVELPCARFVFFLAGLSPRASQKNTPPVLHSIVKGGMFFWLRSRGEACQKKNTWHLATPSYMVAFACFPNTEQKPTLQPAAGHPILHGSFCVFLEHRGAKTYPAGRVAMCMFCFFSGRPLPASEPEKNPPRTT